MPPDAFTKSLTLVKAIYRNFPIGVYGTHVALAVYGVNTQIIFNFTALTSKVAVNGAVDKVKYPGSANTLLGKGLSNFKRSVFDTTTRPGARKVLVVFIAGVSQDNIDGPSREIRDNGMYSVRCLKPGSNIKDFSVAAVLNCTYMTLKAVLDIEFSRVCIKISEL